MLSLSPRPGADVVPHNTPSPPPVAPELGRTFVEACVQNTPQSTSHLRNATVALVARLKADGLPPERVVIAIKTALVRHGGYPHTPSFDDTHETPLDERRTLKYRCVFRWYLDAYYGTSDAIRCCLSA